MKIFLLLLSLGSAFLSLNTQAKEQQTYTIGIVPQFEIRHIRKIWSPIINEIKKNTGITLKLIGSPTIPTFEKEIEEGLFDFAYMNPYHILQSKKAQQYIPLIRDTGRRLHGILVVRRDSGINSVSDLDGKKVAFPSPNALGATLLIRANLAKEYKVKINPIYVKSHSSVYLNVAVKQTLAGGGVQKTLNQQKENIKAILKVLIKTPGVAPHPLAVHPRVPEEVRKKIKKSLLSLGDSAVGRSLLARIPIKKIGPANMSDYAPLANLNLKKYSVK